MPFEYSCFISYRRGQGKLLKRIIKDLYEALWAELEAQLDEGIFLDESGLEGGDYLNEEIALALSKSACMVMAFIPKYFSKEHTYCAREFKAMEELENKRLSLLPENEKNHGLIIPIIFRGSDYLPPNIKNNRICYNFEEFLLCHTKLYKHPRYAPKIKRISEYIARRTRVLKTLPQDPHPDCDNFRLPSEEEILLWLDEIQSYKPKLPMR